MPASTRTTGNDPIEGVDPGGTRSTKPGNPDKTGASKPEAPRTEQNVVSGDQNAGRPRDLSQGAKMGGSKP